MIQENKESTDRRADLNKSNIFKLQNSLNQVFTKLDDIDRNKADTCKVDILLSRIDGFANIEHIKKLKEWFLPRIENFALKIDNFEVSNESVRECILKFDQDISLKASKSEILVL